MPGNNRGKNICLDITVGKYIHGITVGNILRLYLEITVGKIYT